MILNMLIIGQKSVKVMSLLVLTIISVSTKVGLVMAIETVLMAAMKVRRCARMIRIVRIRMTS